MKNLFVKTLIAAAIPAALVTCSVSAEEQEVFKSRFIVKYKQPENGVMSRVSQRVVMETAAETASDDKNTVEYLRAMGLADYHVMGVKKNLSKAEKDVLIEEMKQDPSIESVEEDQVLQHFGEPTDPYYTRQWNLSESTAGLNLPAAWNKATGEGVVVAVLDTGYRPHADLKNNLLPGYDMISDTFMANDRNGRDADALDPGNATRPGQCGRNKRGRSSSWHGTHVAGIIAAEANNHQGISGVAYNAKIVPVRVLGRCGGLTSDIADGIVWAAGGSVPGVPDNPNPAKVINLSLGGPGYCQRQTQQAINFARSQGATIVVAAGNSNSDVSRVTPASCEGVISVAALGRSSSRASYSNYGSKIDIAAPGGDGRNGILSTVDAGSTSPKGDAYAPSQGTSQAAPHVAGVAAMMYELNPNLTPDQVESTIKQTAREDNCYNCGSGLIDADAAVKAISGAGNPTQPEPPQTTTELANGVAKAVAGTKGEKLRFTFKVPQGATNVSFKLNGGFGDADMFIQRGSEASESSFLCKSETPDNNEACSIRSPQPGTYHVLVYAWADFSNAKLSATYQKTGNNTGTPGFSKKITDIRGYQGDWNHYRMTIPQGTKTLKVKLSGGYGDVDLFMNYGQKAGIRSYFCKSERENTSETCIIRNPRAGQWYIGLRAFNSFGNVTMDVEYK
ncbi:S8 family peptidase [Algicola sagamiensis]|uniref:S8 family peptidase n=1 Tax=Algicola sagamiensis TaxID=163869 RepID=UPI0003640F70|nr:S8 family peptidase [Algicola sagamiensis]